MKCQPCIELAIRRVRGSHFQQEATKKGIPMTRVLRQKLMIVIDKYKHTENIDSAVYATIKLNVTPKENEQLRQICHSLGVSVSDFLKITLYNEKAP
jgi:2C-methyl-D-erythritol 2,4-cyclodiphosphate synthase